MNDRPIDSPVVRASSPTAAITAAKTAAGTAADSAVDTAVPASSAAPPPRGGVDEAAVAALYRQLLTVLGEDPDRDGLRDTPRRVAAWWRKFLDYDPGNLDTVFEHTDGGDQIVAVSGITVWSLCEHHLAPFAITTHLAYQPAGQVAGLSKLARGVHAHAHRLQLQERLTAQIAGNIAALTGAAAVGVWLVATHTCVSMRGVRAEHARATTSCLLGAAREDSALAARLYAAAHPVAHPAVHPPVMP